MQYRICPLCGAHLDPEESCTCRKELEEKKAFINQLKALLLVADVDLADLELLDIDTVEVSYTGGGKRRVNIAADSRIAIIRDVAKNIL